MSFANFLRRKFNRPIRFDITRAMAEAQTEADRDLARLDELAAGELNELATWDLAADPVTDGIECDADVRDTL